MQCIRDQNNINYESHFRKGDKFCQVEWKSHIFTTVFTTYYGKRTYLDKGKIFNCKDRWVRKIFSIWIVKFYNPWFLTIYFKMHCQESCVCILLSIKFIRSATYFMAKLTHHLTCYFTLFLFLMWWNEYFVTIWM